MARQTRDTYLPRIQLTVLLLAAPVRAPQTDEFGRLVLPQDAEIFLYPTYTRGNIYKDDAKPHSWDVNVHGWVLSPGTMSRKNRLILLLARQVTNYQSPSAVAQLDHELDDAALVALSPLVSSQTLPLRSVSPEEDTVRQRLAHFIARLIAGAQLEVTVGLAQPQQSLKQVTVETDANGHFRVSINVDYRPLVVQVKAANNEAVFAFEEPWIVDNDWRTMGVISDIDDTVKVTGVIGDKREFMHRLLCREIGEWRIDPMIKWYCSFGEPCTFHYVSNLPWQLFPLIKQYIDDAGLPQGLFHLKQYTGNLISSLMEPLVLRKRSLLTKIIGDFDQKDFICIGDLGESDLEAYVDVARQFPSRVLAVYIRFVENSLSDLDDLVIFAKVCEILDRYNQTISEREAAGKGPTAKPIQPSESQETTAEDMPDLIDLDTPVKPMKPAKPSLLRAPAIKPKPAALRVREVKATDEPDMPGSPLSLTYDQEETLRDEVAPPLPRRPTTALTTALTALSRNSRTSTMIHDSDGSLAQDIFVDLEETDRRGADWIVRIRTAVAKLQGTHTKLRLFRDDDPAFFENCHKALHKELNRLEEMTKEMPNDERRKGI